MVWGTCRFLRSAALQDPEGTIRAQLENRQAVFLDTVRRAVFAREGNPYREMFRLAGCRYEDLSDMVRRDGLETALAAIRRHEIGRAHV